MESPLSVSAGYAEGDAEDAAMPSLSACVADEKSWKGEEVESPSASVGSVTEGAGTLPATEECASPISVFCRVRPLSTQQTCRQPPGGNSGGAATEESAISILDSRRLVVHTPEAVGVSASVPGSAPSRGPSHGRATGGLLTQFEMAKIFPPSSLQRAVFDEVALPLLLKACAGREACVLVYGQSSSGKTHTMFGSAIREATEASRRLSATAGSRQGEALSESALSGDSFFFNALKAEAASAAAAVDACRLSDVFHRPCDLEWGVLPRAGLALLLLRDSLVGEFAVGQVFLSVAELYQEELTDLLSGRTGLRLRQQSLQQVKVVGLEERPVDSREGLTRLLKLALSKRRTTETTLNSGSSRSHLLAAFRVCLVHAPSGAKSEGLLRLVDLAGSERPAASGASGATFLEGASINKSLGCFAQVVEALACRSKVAAACPDSAAAPQQQSLSAPHHQRRFVSFRGSKLTRMLQHVLTGASSGGTRLIITCAQDKIHSRETLASLSLACKASAIRAVQTQTQPAPGPEASLSFLRERVAALEKALETAREQRHVKGASSETSTSAECSPFSLHSGVPESPVSARGPLESLQREESCVARLSKVVEEQCKTFEENRLSLLAETLKDLRLDRDLTQREGSRAEQGRLFRVFRKSLQTFFSRLAFGSCRRRRAEKGLGSFSEAESLRRVGVLVQSLASLALVQRAPSGTAASSFAHRVKKEAEVMLLSLLRGAGEQDLASSLEERLEEDRGLAARQAQTNSIQNTSAQSLPEEKGCEAVGEMALLSERVRERGGRSLDGRAFLAEEESLHSKGPSLASPGVARARDAPSGHSGGGEEIGRFRFFFNPQGSLLLRVRILRRQSRLDSHDEGLLECASREDESPWDCWLAVCGRVFDVTSLVATSRSPLTEPLLQHAGRDVSEWFDPETLLPLPLARVYANCDEAFKAFKPGAPFLHCIGSGFQGTPWWQDERLVIGRFASEVETLKVLNTLTGQLVEVEAPSDAPLGDVVFQELLPLNSHVEAYTLSCLGRALDLSKTLSENGLETNQKALKQHDLPWKELTPSILLHFTGDLSTKQFSE